MLTRLTSPTYINSRNIIFKFISSDNMLLVRADDFDAKSLHYTHLVMPYDRYRNTWLSAIKLPDELEPWDLIDFVGPLTFRLTASNSVDVKDRLNHEMHMDMVTCRISDDLKRITVEKREHLFSLERADPFLKMCYTNGVPCLIIRIGYPTIYIYEVIAQKAVQTMTFDAPPINMETFYYADRKVFFVSTSDCRSTLSSFDMDTHEQRDVICLARTKDIHGYFGFNGKLFIVPPRAPGNQLFSVCDLAASCVQPPLYTIKANFPGEIAEVTPTACGNACVRMIEEHHWFLEGNIYWLWTNPPKLADLALAVIHQNLSEEAKTKLATLDVPLLDYPRFVENVFSMADMKEVCEKMNSLSAH